MRVSGTVEKVTKKAGRRRKANAQKPQRRVARPPRVVASGQVVVPSGLAGPAAGSAPSWLSDELAYLQWFCGQELGPGEAIDDLPAKAAATWAAMGVVSAQAAKTGLPDDPTRWTPHQLVSLLDSFEADGATPDLMTGITSSLFLYFGFLAHTERWPADPLDLAVMTRLLDPETSKPGGVLVRLAAKLASRSAVGAAREDDAVLALPVLADLVAVVRAVQHSSDALQAEGPQPHTGSDSRATAHRWLAVRLAQLVEESDDGPVLTPEGAALAASPSGDTALARRVVSRWLALLVGMPRLWTEQAVPAGTLGPAAGALLLRAMTGKGLRRTDVATYCAQLDLPSGERDALAHVVGDLLDRLVVAGLAVEGRRGLEVPGPLLSLVQWGVEQAVLVARYEGAADAGLAAASRA